MKTSYASVVEFTSAEITAGLANNLPVSVWVLNTTTNALSKGNPSGAPVAMATTADVAASVAAIAVDNWAPNVAVINNELRRATVSAGTIEAGDLIRSNFARTTGATFDATEAGNWMEFSPDIVTSVASKTGAVSLVQADVSNLVTDLAAKQATLVSGTNIRSVNGASLIGAGNVAVAADLPGGAAVTLTNERLATTGSPTIDTTTVPGETIIRWIGSGSFTVPLGVNTVQALVVGAGGGGGGGESNSFGGAGGGGGGGRVRDVLGHVVTPLAVLTVTVPAGGTGGASKTADSSDNGTTGGQSVFGTLIAEGGGGGHGDSNLPADTGYNGGGGSGDGPGIPGGTGAGGFAGGTGHSGGRCGGGGGGAGGAGEAGQTDGTREGGDGGAGNSNGGQVAGGTGGAGDATSTGDTSAAGGSTGPGSGGTAGGTNRGGGGGGGCGRAGFAGGSGVVIVRFPTQTRSYQALSTFVSNAAAITGGLLTGQFYRDSSTGAVQQVQ